MNDDPERSSNPDSGDLASPFLFVPHGAPEPVEWMRKHPGWVKFPATFVPRAPAAVRTIPGTNRPWPLDKRGQPWPRSRFGQPLRPLDEYPPGVRAPGERYTGPIADPHEAMRAAMASEDVLAQAVKDAADPDAPIRAYLSAMEVWKNPGKYAGYPQPGAARAPSQAERNADAIRAGMDRAHAAGLGGGVRVAANTPGTLSDATGLPGLDHLDAGGKPLVPAADDSHHHRRDDDNARSPDPPQTGPDDTPGPGPGPVASAFRRVFGHVDPGRWAVKGAAAGGAAGAIVGGIGGGVTGGAAGAIGGTAVAPGVGTVGGAVAGGTAGAIEGAIKVGAVGAIAGGAIGGVAAEVIVYMQGDGAPALRGDPYHPDSVETRIKPEYRPNPPHDKLSPLFNPNKTPEPVDSVAVYRRSIPGKIGSWYGRSENGSYYQFFYDNAGGAHFAGIIKESEVPTAALRQLKRK